MCDFQIEHLSPNKISGKIFIIRTIVLQEQYTGTLTRYESRYLQALRRQCESLECRCITGNA